MFQSNFNHKQHLRKKYEKSTFLENYVHSSSSEPIFAKFTKIDGSLKTKHTLH